MKRRQKPFLKIVLGSYLLIVFLSCLLFSPSSQGVESPAKVSDNRRPDTHPSLIQDSNGKYLIACQQQSYDGYWDIWLTSSIDGASWENPVPVTDVKDHIDCTDPSLIQDSTGRYLIAYTSKGTSGTDKEIFLITSDDGEDWSTPIQITNNKDDESYPSLIPDSKNETNFHIAFSSSDGGDEEIGIVNLTNQNTTWNTSVYQVTNNTKFDGEPSLIQKDGALFIAYTGEETDVGEVIWISGEETGVENEIWLVKSDDGGAQWTSVGKVTANEIHDFTPSIIVDSSNRLDIVFSHMEDDGDLELYFSSSLNEGRTWSTPVAVTEDTPFKAKQPSLIQGADNRFYIVFRGNDGDHEIFLITHDTRLSIGVEVIAIAIVIPCVVIVGFFIIRKLR